MELGMKTTGIWILILMAALGTATPVPAFKVSKADFPKFVGVVSCQDSGDSCPGAAQGFIGNGLAGEGDFQDPSSSDLAKNGKAVIGFLEGKPFSWSRYSVDFPSPRSKWIAFNELTVGEGNRAFLTLWKTSGDSLEFVKAFPRYFSLSLGELYVNGKTTLPDGSLLLILKGEGSDAGINVQDFHLVRLQAPDRMEEVDHRVNRSEIPVQDILDRLNADQPVDEVQDSALSCEVIPGKKAPSGGPWLRFVKSHTRVLYTKAGPQETPAGKDTVKVDIWKSARNASNIGHH